MRTLIVLLCIALSLSINDKAKNTTKNDTKTKRPKIHKYVTLKYCLKCKKKGFCTWECEKFLNKTITTNCTECKKKGLCEYKCKKLEKKNLKNFVKDKKS